MTSRFVGGAIQYDDLNWEITNGNLNTWSEPGQWIVTTSHLFNDQERKVLKDNGHVKEISQPLQCAWGYESAIEVHIDGLEEISAAFAPLISTSLPTIRLTDPKAQIVSPENWVDRSTSPLRSKISGKQFELRNSLEMIKTMRAGDSGGSPAAVISQNVPGSSTALRFAVPQWIRYASPKEEGGSIGYGWRLQKDGKAISSLLIARENQDGTYAITEQINSIPRQCQPTTTQF